MRSTTKWLSVIGSLASIVALAIVFLPSDPKPTAKAENGAIAIAGDVKASGNIQINTSGTKQNGPPVEVARDELEQAKKRLAIYTDSRARRLAPDHYDRAEKFLSAASGRLYNDTAAVREFVETAQKALEILSSVEFNAKETIRSSEWALAQINSRSSACDAARRASGEAWKAAVAALDAGNLALFNEQYGKAQSHLGGLMQKAPHPC